MGRLSMETIKSEIELEHFKLISEDYKNLETELELECPKGHKVFKSLKVFRRDPTCPTCLETMRTSFEIKEILPAKTKEKYRIIALDQSTTTTGFSIFDGTDLLQSGIYKPKNDGIVVRIADTHQWFVSMLQTVKPDCVIFEDIQKQQNIKTFRHLAFLLGVLIVSAIEHKLPYRTFLSSEWRKPFNITAGTRTDKKQAARQKIIKFYDFKPGFDEAEAILIGRYYATKHKKEATLFKWG